MITTKPSVSAVSTSGTLGQNFNVTGTAIATYGGLRSAKGTAVPSLTIATPAGGATVVIPFTITGIAWPPGSTVAFVNDTTGTPLGTAVVSNGVTGAYTFTVTTAGA